MARLPSLLTFCLATAAAAQLSTPIEEVPITALGFSANTSTTDWSSAVGESAMVADINASSPSQETDQVSETSALSSDAALGAKQETRAVSPSELPIFFFHGLTCESKDGANIAARLTAAGRTINVLSFSEGEQSKIALNIQVPLAVAQIRSIIARDSEAYANGYIFIGHSQGGALGRAVVEAMHDHKVLMLISLAGVLNGMFYGPQAADAAAIETFTHFFAPATIPTTVFDTPCYSPELCRGQLQHDFIATLAKNRELSDQISMANLWRSPDRDSWLSWNPWLPVLNNINVCSDSPCEEAKAQRKRNFLKLKALYSFMSPRDGAVAPWQTSHFAQYNDVSDLSEIVSDFEQMTIVPMEQTLEFIQDTYGLRTLHSTGRLHLREVADVDHICWIRSGPFLDNPNEHCSFDLTFDTYVYPLVASTTIFGSDSCTGCQ